MVDFPEYAVKPNTARIVFPQIILTALLAGVFYAGIAVNVYLLGVSTPLSIKILIMAVLSLLVVIQALLSYVSSTKTKYLVYKNKIQIEGIKPVYVMFNTVQELKAKRNIFDKFFKTGTIVAGDVKIKAVPNFDSVFMYVKQMVQYSRTQYNRR